MRLQQRRVGPLNIRAHSPIHAQPALLGSTHAFPKEIATLQINAVMKIGDLRRIKCDWPRDRQSDRLHLCRLPEISPLFNTLRIAVMLVEVRLANTLDRPIPRQTSIRGSAR